MRSFLAFSTLFFALAILAACEAADPPPDRANTGTTPETGVVVTSPAVVAGTGNPEAGGTGVVETEPLRKATPAVQAKPLSDSVKKGLAWLVSRQHENGGWGQGDESANMGNSLAHLAGKPNVGDTCAGALALIRSGSTPTSGPYSKNLVRALGFVCQQVEQADDESMSVTDVQGTRLQMKIGTYVDTFFASLLLAETKDRMGTKEENARILACLDKVMDKIERNQKADGTFDHTGWAPVLSLAICTKGVNRAFQNGFVVSESLLQKNDALAKLAVSQTAAAGPAGDTATTSPGGEVVRTSGRDVSRLGVAGGGAAGAAGVELYAGSASVGMLQDSANNAEGRKRAIEEALDVTTDVEVRARLEQDFDAVVQTERAAESAQKAIVDRMEDTRFLSGFGSNGGEEFLSYMNIAESLVVKGGDDWKRWDAAISRNIEHIQNEDGSWTGHHCITGRTFCTSAALLTLMADRLEVPQATVAKSGR